MRYFLETYGCQMNKAESSALEVQCAEHGWLRAARPEEADLVVINTCSVRLTAENRAWGRINHYVAKKRERPFFLVVTGCMAERLKESMRVKQPGIDYVLGNFQKQAFSLVLDAAARGERLPMVEESPEFAFAPSHLEPGAFRAYVPIMHGCNNFCSYCIVPYVRGRELSRDPEAVLHEIDELAARGIREVTLLGQNVNSYRWEAGATVLDFPALLRLIAARARGGAIQRIRFVSSHPKDLSDDTIRVIAEDSLFARHIHLCVQHGSDRVLAAMNRKYTRAFYLDLVARMRARIPGLTLSTDLLMGFPGETEEDVHDTLSLMREVGFAYAYMYYFNPREGTPAVKLPGALPDAIKKERLARVIALQKDITRELMKGYVGSVCDILVEDVSKKQEGEVLGRTDQDMMVVFPAPQSRIGSFVKVRLDALRGVTFRAQEVE
ncbi:MAG TPA: tRNA (N6-isopentenyl adenosine(37)-C2)-methylthiotransferase MiaB [Spirochaetaceae bacterium]|jgi:tRNA-2-methylthio-N6-dimethylallyladenosine synthase|nr:tRNA (N6-isopentenyl adenosine(37)-C2)-methylthiotransferase MiaB [Spirochaetaceae bacterium]